MKPHEVAINVETLEFDYVGTGEQNNNSDNTCETFPDDLSKSKQHEPTQPKLSVYPWRFYGNDKTLKRRFQTSFHSEYPWIEYSIQQNAAFCFCCRFWGNQSSPFSEPKGFTDWKHSTGKNFGFCQHNTSVEHLRCYGE